MHTTEQQQSPDRAAADSLKEAQAAFRRLDFDTVISLCRRILGADPRLNPAFDLLAGALLRSGRIEKEIGALKASAAAGKDSLRLYRLGELQRVAGAYTDAIRSLERAAGIDPENAAIRLSLGRALYDTDQNAAAESQFRRALEMDSRCLPAHYFLGSLHWLSEDRKAAEQAFSTALDIDADYPPAGLAMAELLFLKYDSEDRGADLDRALTLARHTAEKAAGTLYGGLVFHALLLTGKILIEREQYAQAKKILEEAGGLPEKHPDLYVALSVCHGALNERKKAQIVSRRLMREFPGSSRRCAEAQAEVLVLEPLAATYFARPLYGPPAYAHADTIAALPPDRVSLHHYFLQGLTDRLIETLGDSYDVIFNNASNAELNVRRGYSEMVQYIVDHTGLPAINLPGPTDLTTRIGNYQRLHGIDHLIFPKTVAVNPAVDELDAILRQAEVELPFPMLARRAGLHRADKLDKVEDTAALRESLERFGDGPCYLVQFHESKHPTGSYLRYRAVFIDGVFYPGRMSLSENWLVAASSTRRHEKKLIEASSELQAEEKRWLDRPESVIGEENMAALRALHDVIGLDCYGVDLGIAGDGRVIVFEANASMNLLSIRRHVAKFPYLSQAAENIKTAVEDLLIGKARGRG